VRPQEGACNRDALPLPAGYLGAAIADDGRHAFGQASMKSQRAAIARAALRRQLRSADVADFP